MKKTEIAEYFNVSRATVADWTRRGCPTDGDLGDVAAWRARRDLSRAGTGNDPELRVVADLMAKLQQRQLDLDTRIRKVNKWPANSTCEPGLFKAAVVGGLILEQAVLAIPGKVISDPTPETLPARLLRAVLEALDEPKGGTTWENSN